MNLTEQTKTKVFGIGFHKTGTTSLANALNILGYRVTGPNGVHDPKIGSNALKIAFKEVKEYDAFQDNPWPIIYKELDEKYPNSKFILTIRPTSKWINSVIKHFNNKSTPMRKWIYGVGTPNGNEHIYIERYKKHNRDVKEYFKNRPEDLLILDITNGDGWEKLCPFLGTNIPKVPFPHANDAKSRKNNLTEKIKLLYNIIKTLF